MENLEKEPLILRIARICTRISFVMGTVIFLVYVLGKNEVFISAGLVYSLLAGFLNSIVLGILLLHLIHFENYRRRILYTAFFMLCNIPVAVLYISISISLAPFKV